MSKASLIIASMKNDTEYLENHPLFAKINTIDHLRIFMQYHIFSVWNFMFFAKRIQDFLAPSHGKWMPPENPQAARMINEIILSEETDIGPKGEILSHTQLYLVAMQEVGANSSLFKDYISSGCQLPKGLGDFMQHAQNQANDKNILVPLAHFYYARESIIPIMFQKILQACSPLQECTYFKFYLQRHIDLDGNEHSHLAKNILDFYQSKDPNGVTIVNQARLEAITARAHFWDFILHNIPNT